MATIEFTDWRKSSRSGGGDNCVEVALAMSTVGVRDSKDPSGPILRFRPTAWKAFAAAVRADEFGR